MARILRYNPADDKSTGVAVLVMVELK